MFNITINVRPTTTTNNITKAEDKPKKEKVTVKVVTWVGAIAAVVACANDALDFLQRLGILG